MGGKPRMLPPHLQCKTKLFGTLGQVLGLSQHQSEALIEGTAQLARQAGVAPQQVLKDIAASSETIATFTKEGGQNLFEAAVAARQFGLNIEECQDYLYFFMHQYIC